MNEKKQYVLTITLVLIIGLLGGYMAAGHTHGMKGHHRDSAHSVDSHNMNAMVSSLEGKEGNDFDKAFLETMIEHHGGAIDMAELALRHGEHAEVKTLANAIIESQRSEIVQMRSWNTAWFGASE